MTYNSLYMPEILEQGEKWDVRGIISVYLSSPLMFYAWPIFHFKPPEILDLIKMRLLLLVDAEYIYLESAFYQQNHFVWNYM